MPCDYKNYPPNWKTEIRPAILERAGNKCEQCGVENRKGIFRGLYQGKEVYQDWEGNIYNCDTSEFITQDYAIDPLKGDENQKAISIVLTISHTDHDTSNNDHSNLKALCQRCHLRHDKLHHAQSRRKKKGVNELF